MDEEERGRGGEDSRTPRLLDGGGASSSAHATPRSIDNDESSRPDGSNRMIGESGVADGERGDDASGESSDTLLDQFRPPRPREKCSEELHRKIDKFVISTLAKRALSCFLSCEFEECFGILVELDQKKPNDPRVLHNMAIAEYFKDGCSKSKKLLEELYRVKKRSEELASAAKEQAEAENSDVYVSKDQFDSKVTNLNIAVTWFHLHHYTNSLSILKPFFQNIEPLDGTIVLKICLLLLDIALACRDAVKFLDAFDYMDKVFDVGVGFGSQGENGSTMQLSSDQISKVSDTLQVDLTAAFRFNSSSCEKTREQRELEVEVEKQMKLQLKLELQLYKFRFLLLTRNLRLAKREAEHAMQIAQKRESSMALLLKSQLAYAHENHGNVIKLLHGYDIRKEAGTSGIFNIAQKRDSSVAFLLTSQLEYAYGNHGNIIKLLDSDDIQKEAGTSGIFNNNLGCIYYQLGKYQASAMLFSKALRSCSSLRNEKPVKTFSPSQDKSVLIAYNCGLLHLTCGKPLLAAQCFQKASRVFCRQPLIWLRLAECCMMALRKGLLEEGNTSFGISEIRLHVVGKGKWRQLMMEENGYVELAGSTEWPKLSLPLARVYLSTGIHLLNESLSNDSKSDLESTLRINETKEASSSDHGEANMNSDSDTIQNSLSALNDICSREKQLIKQALLASMAYVELELENPVKALSAAKSLLQLPDCSKINVFLGNIYAAEALCLLNRPIEAGPHLSVYVLGVDKFELPYAQEDFDQWRMHTSSDCEETLDLSRGNARVSGFLKPEEACGVLFADLAALLATQGKHEQAKPFITQALTLLPNNVQATVTAVYIDLMLGRSQDALARLKQCTRVSFVPQAETK